MAPAHEKVNRESQPLKRAFTAFDCFTITRPATRFYHFVGESRDKVSAESAAVNWSTNDYEVPCHLHCNTACRARSAGKNIAAETSTSYPDRCSACLAKAGI